MPKRRANRVLLMLLLMSAATNILLWVDEPDAPRTSLVAAAERTPDPARRASAGDPDKLALLRALEDESLRAAREMAEDYWSTGATYESAYAAALRDGRAAVREALERRFGDAAREDPLFRPLFRPLDPMHWYLSSDQQLAIQALKIERDLALQEIARDAGRQRSMGLMSGDGESLAVMERYRSGLMALLDAETLLEFELRDSPLASELRASGIELDENEFRETFALLATFGGGRTDPGSMLAAREALRDLLGSVRFTALWAARDPFFAEIRQIAESHGLAESTALAVYEVMVEFQDRRIRLAETAARAPDAAARNSMALAGEEQAAIARLTGEAIAEQIVRGRALQSFRQFSGSGPPPVAAVVPRH